MASQPFAFLICTERSGSNLLVKIIDSHPEFCGPSPSHLIRTFANNRLRYGDINQDDNWFALCDDIADLLHNQLGKWRTQWSTDRLQKEVKMRTLSAIFSHIYETEAQANGKRRIFIKENQIYRFVSFILASFLEAKFIYLVRDPRDMALSWKLSNNHPGMVHRAAHIWKDDQARCLEIYGYLKDTNQILLIRYEDLLSNTQETLQSICNFLTIIYDPLMLEFYQDDLTLENSQRLGDWSNLQKPVLKDNFNKYCHGLQRLEIAYIEALCGIEMEFFGYQLDVRQTEKISVLEKRLVEFEQHTLLESEPLKQEEKKIRAKRLAVIEKIISRKLVS